MKILKGQMPRCAWCGGPWQQVYDPDFVAGGASNRSKSASRTYQATHYLRAFQLRAHDMMLSSAVLFIDVKSAFHCMVRQVLFGPGQLTFSEMYQSVIVACFKMLISLHGLASWAPILPF